MAGYNWTFTVLPNTITEIILNEVITVQKSAGQFEANYFVEGTDVTISADGYQTKTVTVGDEQITLIADIKYLSKLSNGTNTYVIKDANAVHTENVTSTYSPTGTAPVNGTAVASAINGVANKDLSNLTSTGKNISNWSSNVSNCVVEIPQDIIFSLSSGVLTLKSGSKLYVPDGFEQDGTTKKFSTYTCPSDLVIQSVGGDSTSQRVVLIDTSNYGWNYRYTPENCFSGDTQPTPSEANAVWYDTANNLIKRTNDTGNTWGVLNTSFPICVFSRVQNVGVIGIDNIFNGFGYIGNTIFALPGVVGFFPDGRNADGTLKNITRTETSVLTFTWSPGLWGTRFPVSIGQYGLNYLGNQNTFIGGERPSNPSAYTRWYNTEENYWYDYITSWNKTYFYILGEVDLSNGKVIFFNPKTVFHAVDYSEFMNTVGDIETLLAQV